MNNKSMSKQTIAYQHGQAHCFSQAGNQVGIIN
jgi:hypothetical protein